MRRFLVGFLEQLLRIPAGTALYDVFACPSPECATRMTQQQAQGEQPGAAAATATAGAAAGGGEEQQQQQQPFLLRVGVVRSTSRFVRSSHRLAFRHQRKEEDYARKPRWIDELDR
jgi:hypothetical protein